MPRTDPLEVKAKNQGHRRKCTPKKKVFKNFFSGNHYLRKPKKRSLQIFRKVFGVFQRNFNVSKIVLYSSRGQGNFRGLEASRPRPRTSNCVLEAKDVLEDSTSDLNQWRERRRSCFISLEMWFNVTYCIIIINFECKSYEYLLSFNVNVTALLDLQPF